MRRIVFMIAGMASMAIGLVGTVVPLLPTVPFVLLAAYCFAHGSPRFERWIVEHERFGPHVRAWRESGSIHPSGKRAAWIAFAVSAVIGLALFPTPWNFLPLAVAVIGSSWIASRPTTPHGNSSVDAQRRSGGA